MHRYGIGKIVQGAVAKDGNVYLPLQLAGKRWKACAFQDHGAHIGILLEKVHTMADELTGRLVIVGLRSLRTPLLIQRLINSRQTSLSQAPSIT